MIEGSAANHGGTPDEVGTLLTGPDGAFIPGSDFLMDGGVTAANSRDALSGRRRRGLLASSLARRYHESMFSLILTFCLSAVALSVVTYTVLRPLKVTVATLPRRPTAYS